MHPEMQGFRLAIVDLDMTLVDSLRCFHRVFNEALREHGYGALEWSTFVELFCRDELSSLVEPRDRRSVWEYFKHHYEPRAGESRLYKGALTALRALREQGARIVVATGRGTDEGSVERELEMLGVLRYIDSIYTLRRFAGGPEVFSKQEMLVAILADYGALPHEAFMVGDYWTDMLSSAEAGITGIGVETGCKPRSLLRLAGARLVIEGIWVIPLLSASQEMSIDGFRAF